MARQTLTQLVTLVTLMSMPALLLAYPDRVPDKVCDSMRPYHTENGTRESPLIDPQTMPSPYKIKIDGGKHIHPGDSIKVTITTEKDVFKGFLMFAHMSDASPWDEIPAKKKGVFTIFTSGTQLACYDQAVSHSNNDEVDQVEFLWQAPRVGSPTSFKFTATVLKDYRTIYMGIQSEDVMVEPYTTGAGHEAVAPLASGVLCLVAIATRFL